MNALYLTFVLCFVFNSSFSQEYTFDKVAKSTMEYRDSRVFESTNLFNSKDYSYSMQIYSYNDSLIARIFDWKEAERHLFYLDKADSLRPIYIKTDNLPRNSTNYVSEYSKSERKNDRSEIILSLHSKGKKGKYTLTIDQGGANYFPIYARSGNLGFEELIFTEIVPPFNCTVLKSEGTSVRGFWSRYELKSINDINLLVTLPPRKEKKN